MQFNPESSSYAFWHGNIGACMKVTVCRFCCQPLAYSPHAEYLIIVEEHHSCQRMREYLNSAREQRPLPPERGA